MSALKDDDYEMDSSPSTEAGDDLFPGTNDDIGYSNADTPPLNDHLNAAAPGELSPPRSQSNSQMQDDGTFGDGNGQASSPKRRKNVHDESQAVNGGDARPGSGWKSKRAQEEYQRAWENVVDKDFNIREFGDVMAGGQQEQGRQ